jgi:hypothetical protein
VEALIAAKADPNRVDHAGRTALHFAAAAIDPRITVALLEAGARVATTDQKGVTALDIALSRQARPVAAALLAAGARVELNATAAPRMLVDAIILNLRELVERAAADGWNPTAIAGVSSPPITLARYAGATDVAAWLEKYPVAAGPDIAVVGPDDSPPQAKTFKQPVDLRADDVVYPEAQVMVAGVVEVDGTLSYPIVATRDEELRVATLEAVRTWRFTPAQRSGTPVAVAIKFPVIFPIKDNQIYPLNYVDVPPDVRRTSNLIQQIAEQLATSGLRYVGASMVGFVVEKDGSVRDVTLPENLPEDYGRTLRRMVRDSQFSPGIRRGQPVRTWVEMLVGYDLKVTYVIDERARFDLSPKQ